MSLDIQFNLRSDPNKLIFLHNHSYWYKLLTRNPNLLTEFLKEYKKNNHLEHTDRFMKAINTIEILQNVLATLK